MKIGLVSFNTFTRPGGVKRHVLGLYKAYKKRGMDVKIIIPRRNDMENYGKDVILLGTSFPLTFNGSQGDLAVNFNMPAIERILEQEKFDILHFQNFGFPSIVQILRKSNALNILTFHANVTGSNFLKNFPSILYFMEKFAEWKLDGIIGVASFNLKPFTRFKGPKIVIPNGIDPDEFNPRVPKINKYIDGKINILFVGRIEERKGLIYLLKAYEILQKKHSNLRLIIIGEGELRSECEDWVRIHHLKEVHFEGEITGKKIPQYFSTADIYVSPAIFGESFGIVLLEAMACGTPIVGFANQGYKEFLGKKRSGRFLVKPRDFKGLASKIDILVSNNNLRKKMQEWGIAESKKYSWEKIADRVLDFYQICAKKKKDRPRNGIYIDKIIKKLYNKKTLSWLIPQ